MTLDRPPSLDGLLDELLDDLLDGRLLKFVAPTDALAARGAPGPVPPLWGPYGPLCGPTSAGLVLRQAASIMRRMIRLFVGLGNPGPEYEATRHNAGFWWIDALAAKLGARLVPERSYQALAARVNRPGAEPVWLLQPMTFMNRSGTSVAALARFFKIAPAQVLVVHDELDLLPGQSKLKLSGSAAGHNGLKDIHAQLGSPDYWRLRLGIGHPGVKAEVVNYVLKKPSAEHRSAIDMAIERSLAASDDLMAGQMDRALTTIHAQPPRPKPPRPAAAAPAGPVPATPAAAADPAQTTGPRSAPDLPKPGPEEPA